MREMLNNEKLAYFVIMHSVKDALLKVNCFNLDGME